MYTKLRKKSQNSISDAQTLSMESVQKKVERFKRGLKQVAFGFIERNRLLPNAYNVRQINDIVYNEKANIVANFKDFLIFDDCSEFLKRYYKSKEIDERLPKLYDYYENYSKIFPNYIILPEAKYIYKNIQKKQRLIDTQQMLEADNQKKKDDDSSYIFDTKIHDSIMNQSSSFAVQSFNQDFLKKNLIATLNDSMERLVELISISEAKPANNSSQTSSKLAQKLKSAGGNNIGTSHVKSNSINLNNSRATNQQSRPTTNKNQKSINNYSERNKSPNTNEAKVYNSKFKSISQSSNFNATSSLPIQPQKQTIEFVLGKESRENIMGSGLAYSKQVASTKNRDKPNHIASAMNNNYITSLFPDFTTKLNNLKNSSEMPKSSKHASGQNLGESAGKKPGYFPSTTNNKSKPIMHIKNSSMPLENAQYGNVYYIINQNENGNTHINIFPESKKVTCNNMEQIKEEAFQKKFVSTSNTGFMSGMRQSSQEGLISKPKKDEVKKVKSNFATIATSTMSTTSKMSATVKQYNAVMNTESGSTPTNLNSMKQEVLKSNTKPPSVNFNSGISQNSKIVYDNKLNENKLGGINIRELTKDSQTAVNDFNRNKKIASKPISCSQDRVIASDTYSRHRTIDVVSGGGTVDLNNNNFFKKSQESSSIRKESGPSVPSLNPRKFEGSSYIKDLGSTKHTNSAVKGSPLTTFKNYPIDDMLKKYSNHQKQASINNLNSLETKEIKKLYVKSKILK